MLSICVTIKNRSKCEVRNPDKTLYLFPDCVKSIIEASKNLEEEVELVVSDWESTDWPLEEWLPQLTEETMDCSIVTIKDQEYFSRGGGLNTAFDHSEGDYILFLDTDMLITQEFLELGLSSVKKNHSFFPIFYYYKNLEHTEGYWRHTSYGMNMLTRENFLKAGKWYDRKCWGAEDDMLHEELSKISKIDRMNAPGFIHQWHPNDMGFKNKYGKPRDPNFNWRRELRNWKNSWKK